jgi:D-alanyl-D-alanine dipeptidase
VVLQEFMPDLCVDVRYAGSNNFTGQPVPGYESALLLLSRAAAEALAAVQQTLAVAGLACKVFDAYRPQRAVDHFLAWTRSADDPGIKQRYYPALAKRDLFRLGYLVRNSSHSRGSTVDLTLVDSRSTEELDMGTAFDFFDERSRPDSLLVSAQQRANRCLLRSVMGSHGFLPLAEEWWHFTLQDEPWPDTAFDFVVV